jgi:predicted transcriptional regulator
MTKQKNDDAVLVRLPKELREQAEQIAEKQERPLPWLIRKLLQKEIAKEQGKQQPPTK